MVRKYIPQKVINILKRVRDFLTWDQWENISWSQEGEDMVLRRIFEYKKNGFYVDIGAHHPKRFSNTYLFYRRGWFGINADAMPGSMKMFKKWRPRDINLEIGVAKMAGTLDYYIFNEPALNGFSSSLSEIREKTIDKYYIKSVIKVEVRPLRQILAENIVSNQIDFLSIDVEGFDFEVLQSNDWSLYRPKIVLAEVLNCSLHNIDDDPIVRFMREKGYLVYAKQLNTVFFRESTFVI